MQRGQNRADHQHLLVKELLAKIRKNGSFLKQRLLEKYLLRHQETLITTALIRKAEKLFFIKLSNNSSKLKKVKF